MRTRAVLLLSLALNVLLAGMIVFLSRESQELFSAPGFTLSAKNGTNMPREMRTHVVVRRQPTTWADIESDDYTTYIKNLRQIGCPEKTIQDIIVADVDDLFEARIHQEVVLPDQQWWKPEPDMDVLQSAAAQIRVLEAEKNQLLAQLLGQGWNEAPPSPGGAPVRLDGPVLSNLSEEVKREVFLVARNAREAEQTYIEEAGRAGIEPDPAKLAQLRTQIRADLARLLTPEQLEEYQLRYSHTAQEMREQLRGFGSDADEFRRIFRAREGYDAEIAALPANAGSAARRAELERLRDAAVRQAIGTERFPNYQMTQNPLFRDAQARTEESGATPEKVLPIYQINEAASAEVQRLQNDNSLSDEERLTAIRMVQDQQQTSIEKVLRGEGMLPPPVPEALGE